MFIEFVQKLRSKFTRLSLFEQDLIYYRTDEYKKEKNRILKAHLVNIKSIINNGSGEDVAAYLKMKIDYHNYKYALETIEKENPEIRNERFGDYFVRALIYLCEVLNHIKDNDSVMDYFSMVSGLEPSPSYPILKLPTLVSAWEYRRIAANIATISGSKGNVLKPDTNIINSYIYPLGIALTQIGNHSQLSAILHAEGDSQITEFIDLRPLLEVVQYKDGEFKLLHEGEWCSSLDQLEKYYFYSEETKQEILEILEILQGEVGQMLGLLLEIGRVLMLQNAVPVLDSFNPYSYLKQS